jgi:hypothetical protein
MLLCLAYRINYFSGPFASIHLSLTHFSRRARRQAEHRLARQQLGQLYGGLQSELPLPLVSSITFRFPTCYGAQSDRLLELHIMHVLDPGKKSCSYVHHRNNLVSLEQQGTRPEATYEMVQVTPIAPHHLRQQRMEWERYHSSASFSNMRSKME